MGKPKLVQKDIDNIFAGDLDGSLEATIDYLTSKLKEWQELGFRDLHLCDDTGIGEGSTWWRLRGYRLETPKEQATREARERALKAKKKQDKEKKKAEEFKTYQRLKKKFEKA